MNRRLTQLWFVIVGAGALIAVPFLLRADSTQRDSIEDNHDRIAAMTVLDREALERNYDRWLDLSPVEQQRYRELQRQLEQDAVDEQGRLRDIKETYVGWLRTLRPDQRSNLRITRDSQARLEMIREYVAEQRERQIERQSGGRRDRGPGGPGSRFYIHLTSDDVDAMMRVVERSAAVTLPAHEKEQLNALQGVSRHLKLLDFEFDHKSTLTRVFTTGLVNAMIDSIESESTREKLRESPREDSPIQVTTDAFVRFKTTNALTGALWREWKDLSRDVLQNADKNLPQQFESRTPEEQDRLLTLPPDEFKERLRNEYVREALGLDPRRVFESLMNWRGSGRRPDGEGPPRGPRR